LIKRRRAEQREPIANSRELSTTPGLIEHEPSTSRETFSTENIELESVETIDIPEPPNMESNELIASIVDTVDSFTVNSTEMTQPTLIPVNDETNVSSSQDVKYRTMQDALDVCSFVCVYVLLYIYIHPIFSPMK